MRFLTVKTENKKVVVKKSIIKQDDKTLGSNILTTETTEVK